MENPLSPSSFVTVAVIPLKPKLPLSGSLEVPYPFPNALEGTLEFFLVDVIYILSKSVNSFTASPVEIFLVEEVPVRCTSILVPLCSPPGCGSLLDSGITS